MKTVSKAIDLIAIVLFLVCVAYSAKHIRDTWRNHKLSKVRTTHQTVITNDIRWEKAVSAHGPILLDHKEGKFYYER